MEKVKSSYEALLSVFAEMALDASLRKYNKERLYKEIDTALAGRDVESFIRLTNELKELTSEADSA